MGQEITIKCVCGREIKLKVYGGQYQNEYRGKCECGQEWILTEISELMTEINACEPYSEI